MMNKKQMLIFFLVMFLFASFVNHRIYGNSNSTISQYEVLEHLKHNKIKQVNAKILADRMYNRIKFYQEYEGEWYEKYIFFWTIHEKLQGEQNEN